MPPVVITPPAALITPDDVKAHLRLTGTSLDALLTTYIAAAQGAIDGPGGSLGRAIGQQTLALQGIDVIDPRGWIILPFPPVISIVSVIYGDDVTLDPSAYVLGPGAIARPTAGGTWPWSPGARDTVRVQYQAGYATLPGPIKAALLLMVQDLYNLGSRDPALTADLVFGVGQQQFSATPSPVLSQAADRLLAPFRIFAG